MRGGHIDKLLKALLSLGILGVFAWVVDHRVLARLIGELHPGGVAALALLAILRMWIAALRIRTLTDHRIAIPVHTLARQYFVGAYFNNLLLTSIGGDAVRLLMLARCGLPKSECAVYLLSERTLGAFALLLLALAGLLLFPVPAPIRNGVVGLAVVSGVLGLACLVGRRRVARAAERHPALAGAVRAATSLWERPGALFAALLLSIAFQLASIALSWVVALALGIELSFAACVALVPLVWLITMLPISIGGIGLREASFALLLGSIGLGTEESLMISLGTFAALVLSGAIGAVFLMRDDALQRVVDRARSPRTSPRTPGESC